MVERPGPLSLSRQCRLLGLNRAALYYQAAPGDAYELELMALLDRQYLRTPFYGSRRMTAWLQTQGHAVNRKTAGRTVLVNFPSGHAMSSRRLFLSGLLSSRARLRFAGASLLPDSKMLRAIHNPFANPRYRKTIGASTQLVAQSEPNQGRISYLRIARSLS